jgi:pre-rRNA-processing protein TSR3
MPSPPLTVIITHPKERRAKCTVAWLKGDPRFAFFRGPRRPENLSGYVRLAMEGPVLSEADADCGLLVLDGTWKLVDRLAPRVDEVPTRRLPPLQTAYPRTSKVRVDPDGGLATIEAVYAALMILGRDVSGLLSRYHWGDEFLRLNQELWETLSINRAS